MIKKYLAVGLGLAGLLAASVAPALAQSYSPPQVQAIGPNDLFQDIPNGSASVGNVYANATLLGNYAATVPGGNYDNALIAGDFTKNLFQRGTSVGTITTTATYVADRWFAWSGTSTTIGGAQETAAADVPAGYGASLRITRTGTGVVQACVAQVVESDGSYRFAGQTAEFSTQALAGSGFSAASSDLAIYVITGTAVDEGSAKMAYSLNAGGGGGSGWTGATVWGGTTGYLVPISTGFARYAVEVPVPATTKEIGVAICWTPVGASPSNDYFDFTGAQLTVNSALTTTAGASGVALAANDTRVKSGARRPQGLETALQQRYFYEVSESATVAAFASCWASSVTVAQCMIPFPVSMRATPVFTGDGGLTAGFAVPTTVAGGTLGACTGLAVSTNITSTVATPLSVLLGCTATTVPAAGSALMLYNNSGSGKIKASAEL